MRSTASAGRRIAVAQAQALLHARAQVLALGAPVGRLIAGDQLLAELELHRAALGDLQRAGDRLGPLREGGDHFAAVAQVELVRVEGQLGRRDRALGLHAQQRRVVVVVLAAQVVHVAGAHQAAPELAGDPDDALVALLLRRQPVLLHLEVDVLRAEHAQQIVRVRAGVLGPVLEQALAEAGGQAAGERDHAVGVALDLSEVHRRLAPVQAFQEAGRGELDEVAVAGVVGGEQRQVVALGLAGPGGGVVVDEIDLAADDRLDAVLGARLVELDRAVHDAVVGQAERRLAELRGARRQRVDLARAVEQRVLGVHVQMGAGWGAHSDCMLGGWAVVERR